MEMKKKNMDAATEEIRVSMEQRAVLIYCFVKAAKDMNADYLTIGRNAMFQNGVYKCRNTFTPTKDVAEFTKDYMKEETLRAFDGECVVCNPECLVEESTYCPLVAAWQKLTDDEEFIKELCDIAMCGDRGILSCYPDFAFTLEETLFDNGRRCCVKVEKRGEQG